jgi:hypothetical protein
MGYTDMNQLNGATMENFSFSSRKEPRFHDLSEPAQGQVGFSSSKTDKHPTRSLPQDASSSTWLPTSEDFQSVRYLGRSNSTPPHRSFDFDPTPFSFMSMDDGKLREFSSTADRFPSFIESNNQTLETGDSFHGNSDADGKRIQRSWSAPPIQDNVSSIEDFILVCVLHRLMMTLCR